MAEERLLTLAEVAHYLRLNVETVRRYVRTGKLRAIRLGAGRAGYRVPSSELKPRPTGFTWRASDKVVWSHSGEWPTDPAARLEKLEAIFRRADAIPGNKNLSSIAVEAIREMREANG